jgi:hypothetical protein
MVRLLRNTFPWFAILTMAITLGGPASQVHGQLFGGSNRSVGGISIDPEGVLSAPTVEQQQELAQIRETAIQEAPANLQPFTEVRAVSLRQLEKEIAAYRSQDGSQEPLPEKIALLAGLQRIKYLLVYPERQDIVLVGPAEGWRLDSMGNVVGLTTGRPVLLLDDLMVAFRTRQASRLEPISCSIDPTSQGLQQLRQLASRLHSIGNPEKTARRLEQAVGAQVVTVTGIPATSHFARVLVAADFRMKRMAMNMQPAPIGGMPSYLHLMKAGGRGMHNTTPRWWLAPKYEPLATDAQHLSWQLRGSGVQCMTEVDYVNAQGQISHTGSKGKAAAVWAQTMTDRFEELANHDSAFGHLRNIMDLAILAALVEKEGLLERASIELPHLLGQEPLVRYPAPQKVATTASLLKKGRNWVISASGGVQIMPWHVADKIEQVDSLSKVHEQFSMENDGNWWK